LRVKRQNDSKEQEILARREATDIWRPAAIVEKTALGASRIVPALLKSENRARSPIGDAILHGVGYSFYGLLEPSPAAVAVPCDLRSYRRTPVIVERPVHRQLRRHP